MVLHRLFILLMIQVQSVKKNKNSGSSFLKKGTGISIWVVIPWLNSIKKAYFCFSVTCPSNSHCLPNGPGKLSVIKKSFLISLWMHSWKIFLQTISFLRNSQVSEKSVTRLFYRMFSHQSQIIIRSYCPWYINKKSTY